ncbi:hypothetical protein QQS21_001866 [Conoideocrella luteorostrata]|uniref:THUMP domain-containing protein n=1 Tax=Conoideocrella luteorostrata TaxID=1105319 RepID=A0AAJ0G384_9HYPO|nr:hypothetical protein QQS21_001866 [Conoideocrella luteorostrata]
MPDTSQKRKDGPAGLTGGQIHKKSKGGSAGRWKTPYHKVKLAQRAELGTTLNVGDQGIWVTFARGMREKAIREFKDLCDEYAKTLYGIESPTHDVENVEEGETQDVEASIEAELNNLKSRETVKMSQTFTPVSAGIECLFFMKTMKPIEPGVLAKKMCEDARDCPDPRKRKCKYINRLTPVFDMEKATENGITKVARAVLLPWFNLNEDPTDHTKQEIQRHIDVPSTYAIRHNIRNHTTFKSDEVIKRIAGLIDGKHKVNLSSPDKVILVEIFQLFCGISVVDGKEWDTLKRYNLNALYELIVPDASKD